MSLTDKYCDSFDASTQSRGRDLFEDARVNFLESNAQLVHAEVAGEAFCEVRLEVCGNTLQMDCECRKTENGLGCEHLWAALCAAEAFGDLGKADKRSVKKTPLFLSMECAPSPSGPATSATEPPPPFEEYEYAPLDTAAATRRSKRIVRKQPDESDLPATGHLSQAMPSLAAIPAPTSDFESGFSPPSHSTRESDFQILYVVNVSESWADPMLLLSTYWRQRGRDGRWGRYRELNYEPFQPCPSMDDDHILELLRDSWRPPKAGLRRQDATANLFALSPSLSQMLIPLIAQTGRLFWRTSQQDNSFQPLLWDGGDHWQFHLSVEPASAERYLITGMLTRNGQSLDVSDCVLVCTGRLVFTWNNVARLEDFQAFKWLVRFRHEASIFLSAWKTEQLVQDLLLNTSLPTSHFPSELQYQTSETAVTGKLFIKTAKFKFRGAEQLHATLSFDYGGVSVEADSERERFLNYRQRQLILRDRSAEEALTLHLEELGFRYNTNAAREELGWKLLPRLLDQSVKDLVERDWQVVAQGKTYRKPQEKQARISSGLDWFELKGSVSYDGQEVPLPVLLEAHQKGADCVLLDDGTYGLLPLDWLCNYTMLTELGEIDENALKFKPSQVAILDALLDKQTPVDQGFADARRQVEQFAGIRALDAPEGFQGQLRPYQRQGLGWLVGMQQLGFGVCLADDMGLGKTVQVLCLLEIRRHAKPGKPSLIVLPKSLIFNWQSEAAKFTPALRLLVHTGAGRRKTADAFRETDLVLTTYGTLRQDAAELKDIPFDYCILDESQAIKNADTAVAKAVQLIDADYRLAMSGTPIENHLGELFSQFNFLNPGMMGQSRLLQSFNQSENQNESPDLANLARGLKPFILRRTKEEVASDLPPKSEQVLYCDLEPAQQDHYDELKAYYRHELLKEKDTKKTSKIEVLEALLRLRQAACHPGLINEKYSHLPGTKLDLLLEKVQELAAEKHKVLIFSQFTSLLGMVKTRLANLGLHYAYLDGQTKDRELEVRRFQQQPEIEAFLISLKAGGVGLNLTAADYVFLLDPWWNPAVEAQAIDRAYRIGQKRQVFAYRMIARNTVEEKVLAMQQDKRELAQSIITGTGSFIRDLRREDLEYLLN
jgi:hypothetical protein